MQRPTDNLRADHVLTTRAFRVLSALSARVRAGADFPADDCATLLRFQREFLLAVHMRKEDELLCPAVAMRADDRAAAMVGELFRLREEIEELCHTLVMFWEPAGELTSAERSGFADTVDALVARLQRRQELEENELFPICDATVPADDQLDWNTRIAELETERGGRDVWSERIAALAARWLT